MILMKITLYYGGIMYRGVERFEHSSLLLESPSAYANVQSQYPDMFSLFYVGTSFFILVSYKHKQDFLLDTLCDTPFTNKNLQKDILELLKRLV